MKVLHVVSGLNPLSGGPTRSVKGICRALSQQGIDVTLLILNHKDPFEDSCGVKLIYDVSTDVRPYDIVHFHGIWSLKVHRLAVICRHYGVRYVYSPRGMLDPWALSVKKWKKKLAMFFYLRRDLEGATAFHATAQDEYDHIRAQRLKQDTFIVPNGVDVPDVLPSKIQEDSHFTHTAVFLSRLHPGKGLLNLVEAWSRVKPVGWRMLVVGPDVCGHKAEVVAKVRAFGISDSWQFIDAVDDCTKWKIYRTADLLVHPSVSENFGITIAEGLAAGLPVICTKGTPWSDIQTRRCGLWIELGVDALETGLSRLTSVSDREREEMGANGRRLVQEKFLWPSIGRKFAGAYQQIIYGK